MPNPPVADQIRLRDILARDLQPRIDWAYALEQAIAAVGGGYVTTGNGDPNGLVTKPEGYLFLDLTTPAVWQNQNGGTVWTDISASGVVGAPADATYLVTAAHAGLSAEVAVGATPGGELGGTWGSPTVDATHSGSSHASVQAAAEATAAGALATHEADTTSVHGIANTALLETATGAQAKVDTHVNDATDAHDASAVSVVPFGTIAATNAQAALEEIVAEAGGSGNEGLTPLNPVTFATVDYLLSEKVETIPAHTYDDGAAGVGATVTQDDPTDGILTADFGSPAVGERVVFHPGLDTVNGIYVVTATGDGVAVPWVLTRATDCDSVAERSQFWNVLVASGGQFTLGTARVHWTDYAGAIDLNVAVQGGGSFGDGAATGGQSFAAGNGIASGNRAVSLGFDSVASGDYSTALGENTEASGEWSVAFGRDSVASGESSLATGTFAAAAGNNASAFGGNAEASGGSSFASGDHTVASGGSSFAAGSDTVASGGSSFAAGSGTQAWGFGQRAHSSSSISGVLSQTSDQTYAIETTDDTPTALLNDDGGSLTFLDFDRTCIVSGRVVARRTDTPGTDSAWDFQGVIRGDGAAYTWVGGSDPVPAVIAQDAGAAAWAVDVAIVADTLVITVTGEAATDINWMTTIDLDEVA